MDFVTPLLWLIGTLAVLYGLHRVALLLEKRGWLYYVNVRPKISLTITVGGMLDPAIQHIVEAQQQEYDLEEDESGDPAGQRYLAALLHYPDQEH